MKPDCRDALYLALERGIAGDPQEGFWLFCNASPISGLDESWKQSLICAQSFRPDYLALEKSGFSVTDKPSDEITTEKGAIFLLARDRKANEYNLTNLWNNLAVGSRLIVAGNKNDGIASIRKWLGNQVELADSYSKYHSVVFWADKKSADQNLTTIETFREVDGYHVRDGIFSSDGPDKGSQLLVEHFDNRVKGKVADLGAGWGYLSAELLQRSEKVETLDLFEANKEALQVAKVNLCETLSSSSSGLTRGSTPENFDIGMSLDPRVKPEDDGCQCNFHWVDVTTEFPKKPYHWVIMNPPFHSGRAAEPELGKRFIEVASSTLPSGGRLLMVANRNLPYEQTLTSKFKRFEKLEERDGFKVIEAVK